MFTGIVEAVAPVRECGNGRLIVERPKAFTDIRIGSSIAVSGACLSIIDLNKNCIQFDVVLETLKRTTIGSCKKGDTVHLERAMKADGRLDGHVMQGHVEGVGKVVKGGKWEIEGATLLTLQVPSSLLSNIVPKGSIALDGVSLTVASVDGDHMTVALIPHTLEHTTLGLLKSGDRVNVETDVLSRYATKCSMHHSFMRSPSTNTKTVKANSVWRIGIVYSSFYRAVIDAMRESAVEELKKCGIPDSGISMHEAPGSFEIPLIGRNLAEKKSVDALIALGVIIQGETHHAEILANASARGCMDVQMRYGIPFAYEILYVDRLEQAWKRAEKGAEAAKAILAILSKKN